MREIAIRAAFEQDVQAAAGWYENEQLGLGDEFLDELERAVHRMIENPEGFPLQDDTVRVCKLRRFPYGVYYRVSSNEIVVTSVIHLHRDPDTWKSRG